jgi:DNA-binding GntR family transcriptional regulator
MEERPRPDPRTYVRIVAAVRDQITSGQLRPGEPVPSITVLARDHATSRSTAGKAMRLLERDGVIFRVPGLGYHVSNPPADMTDDMHEKHRGLSRLPASPS